jgi:Ubiquitin-conjugating enzyme
VYFPVARISATYTILTFDKCGLQEWHCTLRGPAGTDFEGGLYHFRIRLPAEYPFRPPSMMLLTPNGRFELNTKVKRIYLARYLSRADTDFLCQICISFTNCERSFPQLSIR